MYWSADIRRGCFWHECRYPCGNPECNLNGFKVKGIYRGYEGLINGEVKELTTQDVSSVIQREERC